MPACLSLFSAYVRRRALKGLQDECNFGVDSTSPKVARREHSGPDGVHQARVRTENRRLGRIHRRDGSLRKALCTTPSAQDLKRERENIIPGLA